MRRALARCLAVLPMAAVVLAACEQPVTTLKNEGKPTPAALTPRASVANGLPLGLAGNIAVDSFSVCSIGADANYTWTSGGWPAFTGFNGVSYPSDPGSSGAAFVANGGTTAPQAWNADKCQVVYAYPLPQHTGGVPVITATWVPQAGVRLDSIIKDSVKAQNLNTHTGPLETIFPATTNTNSVAGVVNNDYGSIAFFYYTLLPSLQIVKTADNASVTAGQQIGFSMVVTNNGPGVANVVTLTDVLPTGSGLAWAVASPATGCSIASGTLTCSLGPLAANASATVHITSPTTAASCTSYSNTASAVADGQPSVQSSAQTTVVCPPSLSLAKAADAGTVSAGSPIGFTLTVTNGGPGTAHNVSLSDPLPTGTGLSWSVTPAVSGCSITSGVLSCGFGDLAANASASVHVSSPTTAQNCTQYSNTGTVTADGVTSVQASASTSVQCPSLSVKKTADATSVNAGSNIGFTVTVTSGGPGTATGVVLTDVLPTGTGLSWSVSPAVSGCSISSGTLTCNLGDLTSGTSVSVHVSSPTTNASCATYNNTASATSTNGASNGSDPASTQVVCPPSLSISKTADAASVKAGSNIGFTVTVSSNGPGTATDVTLSDPLPTGTGISWSMSPSNAACSISGGTLSCTFGSMAAGTTQTVHLTSPTVNGSCGTYNNTATMASTNASGGKASASTSVTGCLTVCTATMGGWGQNANGNNIGAMRDAHFSAVYPSGVNVGTTARYQRFTSAAAINAYLPATGGVGVLDKSYVNPTTTPALTFGGQVTALRLNVDFSNAQVNNWKPNLAGMVVVSGPLAGKTVAQVLTIAQGVLAGGALPSGMTLGDLNNLVSAINGMNSPDGCGFGDGTVKAP